MIDWLDIKNGTPPDQNNPTGSANLIWHMGQAGLIDQNLTMAERNEFIKIGIQQGFQQSPYLKK